MRTTTLADRLSRSWRELGGILTSRRLLATYSGASTLTPTKLRALDALAESGGLRIRELADRMAVDETTATRLADRLEAAGVATRERLESDRRVAQVVLTSAGGQLVAEVAGRRHEFFRDVLAALDPHERRELVRLTEKATAALRARAEATVA